jgi:hypothetical protein
LEAVGMDTAVDHVPPFLHLFLKMVTELSTNKQQNLSRIPQSISLNLPLSFSRPRAEARPTGRAASRQLDDWDVPMEV